MYLMHPSAEGGVSQLVKWNGNGFFIQTPQLLMSAWKLQRCWPLPTNITTCSLGSVYAKKTLLKIHWDLQKSTVLTFVPLKEPLERLSETQTVASLWRYWDKKPVNKSTLHHRTETVRQSGFCTILSLTLVVVSSCLLSCLVIELKYEGFSYNLFFPFSFFIKCHKGKSYYLITTITMCFIYRGSHYVGNKTFGTL